MRLYTALLVVILSALAFATNASAQQPSIFMFSPMGGENYIVDSTYNIRWLARNITGTLRIEYSVDSGSTWKFIDTVAARTGADSLAWRVPNDTTRRGFVRVRTTDSAVRGSNRTPISITTSPLPILRLIYPNGGELLRTDSTYFVRWTSSFTNGPLVVDYSIDSGMTWRLISSVVPRGGVDSLEWIAPSDTTTLAFVRVRSIADNMTDMSNRVFSIRSNVNPKITLVYPNGGQVFEVDSTIRVRWIGEDLSGQLIAQYSPDNGATWKAIGQGQPRTARIGPDSLTWRIPNDTTNVALVRLTQVNGPAGDTSNATFRIIPDPTPPIPPTPTIAMMTQLAGAVLRGDSVITVRWSSANISGPVTVEYSPDSGSSWLPIHQEPQGAGIDTMRWTVPNDSTHTAVLRARNADATVESRTTGTFTVLPKIIVLAIEAEQHAVRMLAVSPNPINGVAELRWTQAERGDVTVRVVSATGDVVVERIVEMASDGDQSLRIDCSALASGTYWCVVACNQSTAHVQLTVVH